MRRLIDADALITSVLKKAIDDAFLNGNIDMHRLLIQVIAHQPTIDAEPVRHGKWIIRDNPGTGWYRVTCSECGEDVTATAPCIGFYPNARVTWNYCPNCGAKMDEE